MRAAALVLAIAACSITHRSDELACTKQADCASGRVCTDGFCVGGGNADSASCPAPCTSCDLGKKTCNVDCSGSLCNGPLMCPSGFDCTFQCDVDNSCRNGIDCTFGHSCTINCLGRQACRGITCGPGECSVACSGAQSCRDVSCGPSCACDVACTGDSSCTSGGILCTNGCLSGRGCTSAPGICHHTCP